MSGGGRRSKGRIEKLPSGALRVVVYAGIDPVTKRRHFLRETVPAGPKARADAQKLLRKLANQIDERRNPTTNASVNQLLDEYFEGLGAESTTARTYHGYVSKHIRPFIGQVKIAAVDAKTIDSLYTELRRCRDHCDRRPFTEHRTERPHECDERCGPHVCKPLSSSTVRQIHFILSGAFKKAVRWGYLASNPLTNAEPPTVPKPNPRPPTPQEAAEILDDAARDPDWGALVWVAMTTGCRRGELCGLRWRSIDLENGVATIDRSIAQSGREVYEKDTKTHQARRITLDDATVEVLKEHWAQRVDRAAAIGVDLERDAFVFSNAPDASAPLRPDSVTERYADMVERLGIRTTLHRLRHYNATELIGAGVDIRTVAGRLGHSGGGTTTLRVYSAWLSEADQRAAGNLLNRLPARDNSSGTARELPELPEAEAPYQVVAHKIAATIADGTLPPGSFMPSPTLMAKTYGVGRSTVVRAVAFLAEYGIVETKNGRRSIVARLPEADSAPTAAPRKAPRRRKPASRKPSTSKPPAQVTRSHDGRRLLSFQLKLQGRTISGFTAEADPSQVADLRQLMLGAIRRSGGDESAIADYELDIHDPAGGTKLSTFVMLAAAS